MEDKEKAGISDRIWNFFASVRFAIVIFIILALTSIIGTIVPQETGKAMQFLGRIVGDNTAPTVYNIFVKLDFMNMYHSWWFVSLLILFSINLIVCSLDRFPKTWRLVKNPLKPMAENVIKTLPIKKEVTIKTNLNVAKDEFLNTLRASKYHILEATEEDGVQLYTQRGSYTRLGVYMVHLSILIIFAGAIIGARFGYKGFINIPEGGSSDVVSLRTGETIPLGFTVHCNWFNTDYYAGSDIPQEFQSELVIFDGGREVLKKIIEVNHPLKYKGITFYQSSYGMIPDAIGEFILEVTPGGGQVETLRLRPGEAFEIPGTNIKATIVDFSPALGRNPETGALTTYAETMVNPAVAIEFDEPGKKKFKGWILKRYPETGILPDGSQIKFVDYWGVEYTGLQVAKDPGIGTVYLGFTIMTLGFYIAFFMSHKKIWVRLTPEKNSVRITLGGSANKNRLALEREVEKILSKASQAIERRHPIKK